MLRSPRAAALGLVLLSSGMALAAEDKTKAEPRQRVPATTAPAPAPAPAPADEPAPADSPAPSDAVPPSDAGPVAPAAPQEPPAEPDEDLPLPAEPAGGGGKPPQEDAGPVRIALARDTLGGHIAIGAAASLFVPFGSLEDGVSQSTRLDPGLGLRLDAAYGVSRTVMLGVYGELAMPDGSDTWAGGRAQSIAVGPFVRYHLVQGVRFDPWIGFGAGFRRTSRGDDAYTGIDVARIQLGGDYYGFSQFGFGPLVELALGTFLDSSGGSPMGGKAMSGHLTLGARFTFDGPGK